MLLVAQRASSVLGRTEQTKCDVCVCGGGHLVQSKNFRRLCGEERHCRNQLFEVLMAAGGEGRGHILDILGGGINLHAGDKGMYEGWCGTKNLR